MAALGAILLAPVAAHADWLVTPFIGAKVDAQTNLVDLDRASGTTKPIVGVSVSRVSRGILGFEGDLGYMPGFFDSSAPGGLVSSSRVVSAMGQILVSPPASVMRDSLRPYLTVGGGLLHVGIGTLIGALNVSENYGAMSIGVGAIGRTGRRSSVRFDLRRMQTLTEGSARIVGTSTTRLSFWRASVGLSLHY
ncbi:MAG: hypothetical protein AB7I25_00065 [Vicinamibacterales bacterium]